MMNKAYLILSTVVICFFVYANFIGWSLMDSLKSGQWDPHGRSGHGGGHGVGGHGYYYHK